MIGVLQNGTGYDAINRKIAINWTADTDDRNVDYKVGSMKRWESRRTKERGKATESRKHTQTGK